MASVEKRANGKWLARWREFPGGPPKYKRFVRKMDAEQWLVKVQHDLFSGVYIDPAASRVSVDAYYRTWMARMRPTWRASTASLVANSIEKHALPVIGSRALASVKRADIEALCASLPLAPSTVATVRQHLGQLFGGAVDDGLISRNPTSKARLPKQNATKAQPVAPEVVERIAAALPDWMRVVVRLGVGVGLRQGETSGLTVDRIDFLRRTLRVDRQLISRNLPVGVGRSCFESPKTASSNRTIPLAGFVVDALAVHLRDYPAAPDGLVVVDPGGHALDAGRFGYQWDRACTAAGVGRVHYHDLRHTFASTLLSRRVSVKAVADWLGHASPAITLSTYAHVMPTDEDVARSVLSAAFAAPAAEYQLSTAEPSEGR